VLTRISKEDVQLGMYLEALEGSWLSHPFWRTKFILKKQDDLDAIRGSRITAVVIDTSKGLDPAKAGDDAPPAPVAPEASPKKATPRLRIGRAATRSAALSTKPCRLSDEIDRAAEILNRSRCTARELAAMELRKDEEMLKHLRPLLAEVSASIGRNGSALIGLARERPNTAVAASKAASLGALMTGVARQLGFGSKTLQFAGLAGFRRGLAESLVVEASPSERALGSTDCSHLLGKPDLRDDQLGLDRLTAKERALIASMRLICEVYDNITYVRPDGVGCNPAEAVSQLYRLKEHFDPDVLNAFIRTIGIYPAGSLVQLDTERLAVVSDQGDGPMTQPIVRQFFCTKRMEWVSVEEVRLSAERVRILSREDPRRWGFNAFGREWLSLVVGGERPTLSSSASRSTATRSAA
jgi:hypothetical protein